MLMRGRKQEKIIAAIIPARGGSRGLLDKNIVKLANRPLLAWTIEQAKRSSLIDMVFVSTDSKRIAWISRKCGAEIISRPQRLATNTSTSEDAILHAIDSIENRKRVKIDIVVFLQVTSPLRDADDIDKAIRKYRLEKADSLFSCSRLEDHFIWEKRKGRYFSLTYDFHNRQHRQKIKRRYLENGSIYIFKPQLLRKTHNRLGGKIVVYEMDSWKSFQIDYQSDVELCEYYLKKKLLSKRKRDER